MTKNEALTDQFKKSVLNLKEVLGKIESAGENRAVFRDSAIQRFEIAFDLCWKTLKEKLRVEYGIEVASPKKCFQEAFKQNILDNENIWLEMTDSRNETSHTYDEKFAETLLARLPDICSVLEKLSIKLDGN